MSHVHKPAHAGRAGGFQISSGRARLEWNPWTNVWGDNSCSSRALSDCGWAVCELTARVPTWILNLEPRFKASFPYLWQEGSVWGNLEGQAQRRLKIPVQRGSWKNLSRWTVGWRAQQLWSFLERNSRRQVALSSPTDGQRATHRLPASSLHLPQKLAGTQNSDRMGSEYNYLDLWSK